MTCPHCHQEIGEGCHPETSPDCWELKHLSSSPHVAAEVWVTKGEEVPAAALALLGELDRVEAENG